MGSSSSVVVVVVEAALYWSWNSLHLFLRVDVVMVTISSAGFWFYSLFCFLEDAAVPTFPLVTMVTISVTMVTTNVSDTVKQNIFIWHVNEKKLNVGADKSLLLYYKKTNLLMILRLR